MEGNLNPKPFKLSEPANSAVTRLLDSDGGRLGSYGFGVYGAQAVDALPNLRRLAIRDLQKHRTLEPEHKEPERKKRRLEEATKNISEWELSFSNESGQGQVARLLRLHPTILHYISIDQDVYGDKPFFDNETDPTLLRALSNCPNLTKLLLSSTRHRHRHANERRESSTVPNFAAALSTNFLFRNTLTSLSLSRRSEVDFSTPIDASFLTLASSFPNLTHLRLEAEGHIIDDSPFAITGSFSFPSLRSLEISLHFFPSTIRLLNTLSLPSIRLLSLTFEGHKITTGYFDPSLLAEPLSRLEPTLTILDLASTHPLYRTELDSLAKRTLPRCRVRTKWEEGDVRGDSTLEESELDSTINEAKKFADWIIGEAERARKDGSLTAARDLLGSLKEVKARKKWMDM